MDDTLTDLAHARQLCAIFLEASRLLERDDDLRARCQDVLANLAPYPVHPVSTHYRVDPNSAYDLRPVLFDPIEPGDPTMPMWHLGYKSSKQRAAPASEIPDGAAVHERMGDPRKLIWLMTSSNLAPIFPAGQVGLDQLGSEEFDVAVNTVRALGTDGDAFSLALVSRARLGLADELAAALKNWPQAFQIYPQGFSHYFLASHPDMETDPRYLKNIQVVGSPCETIAWPIALSTHMSLEAGPMLQFAIDEMLLQSYSGTIRVFPAVPAKWEGAFRLHAVGRFVVSAQRRARRTRYVVVESHGGEECRLANPWPGEELTLYERLDGGWVPRETTSGTIVTFATQPDDVLLALPASVAPATLERLV